LPVFSPAVSHSTYLKYGIPPDKYYTLISITLVSLVPMLCGLTYGSSLSRKKSLDIIADSESSDGDKKGSVLIRIFTLVICSFILIILSILIIRPFPAQGWLRTLYAAILLSIQAPAGFLYTGIKNLKRFTGIALSVLHWLFIIALPVGLLLHHPWNRIACFSPYYWVAWAWMLKLPAASAIYGSVAFILTSVVIMILLRLFLRHSA